MSDRMEAWSKEPKTSQAGHTGPVAGMIWMLLVAGVVWPLSVGAAPPTTGPLRTLVIPVNFLDDTSEPFTTQEIAAQIGDGLDPASMDAYIREVSYGRALLDVDVLDWTTLPVNSADCFTLWNPHDFAPVLDLVAPLVDLTVYDRFLTVAPHGTPGIGCGLGLSTFGAVSMITSQGTITASVAASTIPQSLALNYVRQLIHEFGHSIELAHAMDLDCGDQSVRDAPPCDAAEGTGDGRNHFSNMGQTGMRGHLDAPHKEFLGWLLPDQIAVIAAGQARLALDPIELPSSGVQVIKLPATYTPSSPSHDQVSHYYVSYRQPIGLDAIFSELSVPETGLLLHFDMRATSVPGMGSALVDTTPHLTTPELSAFADTLDTAMTQGDVFVDPIHELFVHFEATQAGQALVSAGSIHTNRVQNGGFAQDLAGWSNLLFATWSSEDAANSAHSGSVREVLDPPMSHGLRSPCTEVVAGLDYDYGVMYRISSGQVAGYVAVQVQWYDGPDCTLTSTTNDLNGFELDAWTWLGAVAVAPPTAVSAKVLLFGVSAVEAAEWVAYFDDAQLVARLVNLIGADLSGQDLDGADLSLTTLAGADLSGATLRGANLSGSNLLATTLIGANLAGADLSGAEGLPLAIGDESTLYSATTDFTGTGFDPVAANWTLSAPAAVPALSITARLLLATILLVSVRSRRPIRGNLLLHSAI